MIIMSDIEYLVYSYFDLPVITRELATEDELIDEFGCVPDGRVEGRDRIMKCIKITRLNRKKIEEGWNIDIIDMLPDIDSKAVKKMRFEDVERSW